ncbi:pyridoxamine 5'-phosphate oxidase family protein [Polaromonas sp.]|jgi:general stress protein 26|uniref:pyridoxamine 5'-phosphate oxidase family protein n=1 Tax=Polaromonas sp. TaxID=1869339 RepID=UPI002C03B328|nr:pyridoxamine 5'-phosphate oxidase family protein [Polaromonas sp.]HQS33228.1 pyridoxamine 5'-phosphate oxidase family protein [Polaromonas sp.]HQS92729.1 pyridoxamine 5'-phosphate oxidase family protein [Polaromonas sp.]
MNTATHPSESHEKLWDLIKDIKFGMLTHRHATGMMHSCPLTTQNKKLDEDSQLYFFISRKSELASALAADANVNVSYADPGKDSYVSVSGVAAIREDQAKKQALWSAPAKAWFAGGVDDPDLALLAISIDHAEYWDVKESKMVQLAKMAAAAFTGKQPRMGEHKELNLS